MKLSHTAFFGDATYTFALTDTVIREFEKIAGAGIGFIFARIIRQQYSLDDIIETIRLGLIGGGTNSERAARLVNTYAKDRPLAETLPLALDILDARWSGTAEDPAPDTQGDLRQAAASGDLAAAIRAAYADEDASNDF